MKVHLWRTGSESDGTKLCLVNGKTESYDLFSEDITAYRELDEKHYIGYGVILNGQPVG